MLRSRGSGKTTLVAHQNLDILQNLSICDTPMTQRLRKTLAADRLVLPVYRLPFCLTKAFRKHTSVLRLSFCIVGKTLHH